MLCSKSTNKQQLHQILINNNNNNHNNNNNNNLQSHLNVSIVSQICHSSSVYYCSFTSKFLFLLFA